MTRHDTTIHYERQKARTTEELEAHVAAGELSGRMRVVAQMVSANPQSFSGEDAAKLRNAAQVAGAAADLIDGGNK